MGDDDCRVSVVVPCRNAEATVSAALDSVLAQEFRRVEVIVVDDGSTDGTSRILADYASRYPGRVRILRQSHAGPYAARNLAARSAGGEYLAFLDSDDAWEPTKLTKQVALLDAHQETVLCHTGGTIVTAEGQSQRVFLPQPEYRGHCLDRLLIRNRLATSSVLLRRRVFEEVGGFDEAFPARGDWELWTRMASRGAFAAIDEPLIRYRMHARRMSLDTDRMRHYHLKIIDWHAARYRGAVPHLGARIRESRFAAHMAYGNEYLEGGRPGRARIDALLAIRLRPWAAAPWKLLVKSLIGRGVGSAPA